MAFKAPNTAKKVVTIVKTDPMAELSIEDFNRKDMTGKLADFQSIWDLFSYLGFDAEAIFNTIKSWVIKEGLKELKIKTIGDLVDFLIGVAAFGSVKFSDKRLGKTSEWAKETLSALVKGKYIVLKKEDVKVDSVTLGRIVTLFPLKFARLLPDPKTQVVLVPEGFSRAMCFPQAASLIPTDSEDAFKAWVYHFYIEFLRIIGVDVASREGKKTMVSNAKTTWLKSTWISKELREDAWKELLEDANKSGKPFPGVPADDKKKLKLYWDGGVDPSDPRAADLV